MCNLQAPEFHSRLSATSRSRFNHFCSCDSGITLSFAIESDATLVGWASFHVLLHCVLSSVSLSFEELYCFLYSLPQLLVGCKYSVNFIGYWSPASRRPMWSRCSSHSGRDFADDSIFGMRVRKEILTFDRVAEDVLDSCRQQLGRGEWMDDALCTLCGRLFGKFSGMFRDVILSGCTGVWNWLTRTDAKNVSVSSGRVWDSLFGCILWCVIINMYFLAREGVPKEKDLGDWRCWAPCW